MQATSASPEDHRFLHMAAGIAGGFSSTVALYPLELIKTRMQVVESHSGRYTSIISSLTSVVRSNGFMGLYRGLSPAVIASSGSWGGYFFFYEQFKLQNATLFPDPKFQMFNHLLSGVEAGSCLVFFFNPLWVIKTRMSLQGTVSSARQYSGIRDAFSTMLREEGWRGFYKGVVPALLLTSHGAIQFAVYEHLKDWGRRHESLLQKLTLQSSMSLSDNGSKEQSLQASALFGSISKFVASTLTYPYQVIKSRLQQGDALTPRPESGEKHINRVGAYTGTLDCIRKIWANEGVRGFFRGVIPSSLRSAPSAGITFLVYEETFKLLKKYDAAANNNNNNNNNTSAK